MKDRFTRGFIIGMIAGIPSEGWNLISRFALEISQITYADFAAVLIYGKKPATIVEFIFAETVTFFWLGLLGVLFLYIIPAIDSKKNLMFKGWAYGVFVWFFAYAVTILFKVPELAQISLSSSASHSVGASFFGFALAILTDRLEKSI